MNNLTLNSQIKNQIAGYILAGGRSSRFKGQAKGMQLLNGQPLISHCIDRLKPQVSQLHINSHLPIYEQFKLPLISDLPETIHQGPLSGLYASLRHFCHSYPDKTWLFLAPCDSPFIPIDIVSAFINNLDDPKTTNQTVKAACISYENQLQPTFSIWHKDLLKQLEQAVKTKNWGGLKFFFNALGNSAFAIHYPKQNTNPFFNINSPFELQKAEQLL